MGVKMPNEATISKMWEKNPDGAGFMYTVKKRVYIEKGFMNLKELLNALAGLEKRIKKLDENLTDISVVMHFRITTHGGTSPQNTHPFPITPDQTLLTSLEISSNVAFAHNGIIDSVSAYGALSDTQVYSQDILSPLYAYDKKFYKNTHMQELMENTINGSRLVFLDRDGDLTYVGKWHELDGIKYSNLNHTYTPSYNYRSYAGQTNYLGGWVNYDSAYNPMDKKEKLTLINRKYEECDACVIEKYSEEIDVVALPVGAIIANYYAFDLNYMKRENEYIHVVEEANKYYTSKDGDVFITFEDNKNTLFASEFYEYVIEFDEYDEMHVINAETFVETDGLEYEKRTVVYL